MAVPSLLLFELIGLDWWLMDGDSASPLMRTIGTGEPTEEQAEEIGLGAAKCAPGPPQTRSQ